MSRDQRRPLAPHVRAMIAAAAQAKIAGSEGGGRPMAAHVQRAIAAAAQPKIAGSEDGGRPVAAHVQGAIAAAAQPKIAGSVDGGRPLAAHVQGAIAAGQGAPPGPMAEHTGAMQAKMAVAAHVQRAVAGVMQGKEARDGGRRASTSRKPGSIVQPAEPERPMAPKIDAESEQNMVRMMTSPNVNVRSGSGREYVKLANRLAAESYPDHALRIKTIIATRNDQSSVTLLLRKIRDAMRARIIDEEMAMYQEGLARAKSAAEDLKGRVHEKNIHEMHEIEARFRDFAGRLGEGHMSNIKRRVAGIPKDYFSLIGGLRAFRSDKHRDVKAHRVDPRLPPDDRRTHPTKRHGAYAEDDPGYKALSELGLATLSGTSGSSADAVKGLFGLLGEGALGHEEDMTRLIHIYMRNKKFYQGISEEISSIKEKRGFPKPTLEDLLGMPESHTHSLGEISQGVHLQYGISTGKIDPKDVKPSDYEAGAVRAKSLLHPPLRARL